ncbi:MULTISPECIES: TetR/AcrR family transcriptional regulator [unclassified Mycolicibacterium]|uniref:TetR/AcrR family transcriptional regulator n=1 Tax=unclassified Mycolicibacterium TaxID=2636767 RepID=UPI002ED9A0E8
MTPAGPVRRRLPPAERRAGLLDAASTLFVEHGVAGTSIDDVADRAGVSKGAVYHHFASKDDLVAAVEQRFATSIRDKARSACAHAADLEAALASWTIAVVNGYLDELALHDALFYGWAPASREAASDNVLIDDLRQLLLDTGALVDVPTADLAAGFAVAGITTAVDRAVLAGRAEPRDPVISVAIACTIAALTAALPAAR